MSINDFIEKVKPFYSLFLCVIIAVIFFALGRLSALEERHTPLRIIQSEDGQTANAISAISAESGSESNNLVIPTNQSGGEVIGSKTGKKYYYPWCGSLKRVKVENRVTFASIEEAKLAGYTPAGNCAGLK